MLRKRIIGLFKANTTEDYYKGGKELRTHKNTQGKDFKKTKKRRTIGLQDVRNLF